MSDDRDDRKHLQDVIKQEKEFLRDELRHLKDCQLRYVQLAVGGTGAFFALMAASVIGNTARQHHWLVSFIFLTPLVFVIPCARIFFDKARTISRLVGYFRLLEAWTHTHAHYADRLYVGWERALSRWRAQTKTAGATQEDDRQGRRNGIFWKDYFRSILFGIRHDIRGNQYWFIVYNVFFWISAIIVFVHGGNMVLMIYDISLLNVNVIFSIFMLFVALSVMLVQFGKIGAILDELVRKEKTYDANEKRWWTIHLAGYRQEETTSHA